LLWSAFALINISAYWCNSSLNVWTDTLIQRATLQNCDLIIEQLHLKLLSSSLNSHRCKERQLKIHRPLLMAVHSERSVLSLE